MVAVDVVVIPLLVLFVIIYCCSSTHDTKYFLLCINVIHNSYEHNYDAMLNKNYTSVYFQASNKNVDLKIIKLIAEINFRFFGDIIIIS